MFDIRQFWLISSCSLYKALLSIKLFLFLQGQLYVAEASYAGQCAHTHTHTHTHTHKWKWNHKSANSHKLFEICYKNTWIDKYKYLKIFENDQKMIWSNLSQWTFDLPLKTLQRENQMFFLNILCKKSNQDQSGAVEPSAFEYNECGHFAVFMSCLQ